MSEESPRPICDPVRILAMLQCHMASEGPAFWDEYFGREPDLNCYREGCEICKERNEKEPTA
jgi:hypothetical protein